MSRATLKPLDPVKRARLKALIDRDPAMVRASATLTAWRRALRAGFAPVDCARTRAMLEQAAGPEAVQAVWP